MISAISFMFDFPCIIILGYFKQHILQGYVYHSKWMIETLILTISPKQCYVYGNFNTKKMLYILKNFNKHVINTSFYFNIPSMGETIVKPSNYEFVCCGNKMCPGYTPGTYVCDACGNRGIEYTPNYPDVIDKRMEEIKKVMEDDTFIKEKEEPILERIQEIKQVEELIPAPQNQLEDPILEKMYMDEPIPKTRSHSMSLRPQPRLNYHEYFGRPRKRRRKL